MAPLPPVPDVIKASLNWQIQGNHTAESILHFVYAGGPPSSSVCSALAADIQAAAVSNLKALLPIGTLLGQCTVLDLASATGAQGVGGTATAGTRSGQPLVASTCVVMNHSIARRYRGGKPRSYCPFGIATDPQTAGTWQAGFLTTVNTAWSTFITTALAAASGGVTLTEFASVSYYHAKVLRTTPVVDPITQSLARTRIGTQRRRNKTA